MKNYYNNRKTLYLVLSIVLVSVFTLTIAYAALNTVLKITGTTEVVASSWDIYLDNPQLINGSATTSIPTITDKTTASFQTTLTNPGDYYMFTIDVVNNGSIDAMIDSIEKNPTLTESQSKYLNYIVEYQNGESINTKQLVKENSFVRLKVKVEFRKDIVASDLPTSSETLNLSFKVKYTQADESGENIIDNGFIKPKLISGDLDMIGSEVCIDTECFYVISSTNTNVTMITKYNLFVGNECPSLYTEPCTSYGDLATGIQDPKMVGIADGIRTGTISFSSSQYWSNDATYPLYIYNSNSKIYKYIEYYKSYLENFNISIDRASLIYYEELIDLGCEPSTYDCNSAPKWISSTSYWTGSANDSKNIWFVRLNGDFAVNGYYDSRCLGVRPVITISKSEF